MTTINSTVPAKPPHPPGPCPDPTCCYTATPAECTHDLRPSGLCRLCGTWPQGELAGA